MSSDTPADAEAFYHFLGELLKSGQQEASPEELLAAWRASQQDHSETVKAIQEGLDDVCAGRVQAFDEFDREFRTRRGLPFEG